MKYFKIRLFFKELLKAVSYYKLRFFFSIFSISLGVGSLALIVASIDGANKKAYEIFDVFGPDTVLVIGGGSIDSPNSRTKTLTYEDAISIAKQIPGVLTVIPRVLFSPVIIKSGNKSWSTTVIGTTENYFNSLKAPLSAGRVFDENDVKEKRAVAVIGSKVASVLLDETFINKHQKLHDNITIMLGLLPVNVIGVLKERHVAETSDDLNDRIIMPIGTVTKRLLNDDKYIASLWFRIKGNIDVAIKSVRALLRMNHKLFEAQPDDFRIMTSKEILSSMKLLSNNLIMFLGISGIIALIVGGFIVANLTYLNIKQRSSHLGIKSAFGAVNKDIMLYFLTEEVFITIFGGLLGIFWSIVGSIILKDIGHLAIYISFRSIIIAILLSLILGILAGLKPAIVASKSDPIKAIRG